tara:strand:+ start:43 stop:429 length:387 start_codon:yes stop_codon:yes gene_type:complete
MKNFTILFTALMISCTVSNDAELNGAWKYVSGSYKSNDSINKATSDDINSIKIYTDNRYSVITQITAEDDFFAHSGSYSLEGDTYTESFKLHTNPEMIGRSATFKYELRNKQLIISSDSMEEIWEKIE